MLARLIIFVLIVGFVTWAVRTMTKELKEGVPSDILATARKHAALKAAVKHREAIRRLGAKDVVAEADKILAAMAELVRRRGLLADVPEEAERIEASLTTSEQRLKEALEHLATEQTDAIHAELQEVSSELQDEVQARREIRGIERAT